MSDAAAARDPRTAEPGLLAAARRGDESAFVRLTAAHRRALHRHCYRMLGSLDDVDDALEDVIVGVTGFAGYPQLLPALGLPEELEA